MLAQETGNVLERVCGLHYFGFLHRSEGNLKRAVLIWGQVSRLRDTAELPLEPREKVDFEREALSARATMGDAEFDATWAEGRELSVEQAIALACSA